MTLGTPVEAVTSRDAATRAELVVLAVPWDAIPKAIDAAGGADACAGKVVIDTTNPYGFHGPPRGRGETSSEGVLRLIPRARLVKTFNAMAAGRLSRTAGQRLAMPLAGDDAEAKQLVAELIADCGFEPVDTGSLREGGKLQEPGELLYNTSWTAEELRQRLKAKAQPRSVLTKLKTIFAGFKEIRSPDRRS